MSTITLKKIVKRSKKRLGRGHGSGKVKTSGRGTKGQNARDHARLGFEGGQLALIKRLPFLRGKQRNNSRQSKPVAVDISTLTVFAKNGIVDLETLKKQGIVGERTQLVKILGSHELPLPLTVKVMCSDSAKKAIEKAGGKLDIASRS